MADDPADEQQEKDMDFETALQRLEQIVDELESGQLGLEESLKRFGEAMRLSALCEKKLREAEAKIEEYKVEEYVAGSEQAVEEPEDESEKPEDGDEGRLNIPVDDAEG